MISRRHMMLLGGAAAMPWPGRAQETPDTPRIALVMGNAAYSSGIGTLANPINDARLVAQGISNCGFHLISGDIVRDADRSGMMSAIRQYVTQLQAAGPDAMGFFYYSGHGAARENEGNYLIPVEEADVLDDALWDDSVSLDWLMQKLDALDAPSVVAIDACRNVLQLPEAQRSLGGGESFRGLRRTAGGAGERNMFMSFATWEGETASDGRADDGHGPYASALGTRLNEPATTVRDMFEQVRLDVLEKTLQRQEPMNLSRLQRRSSDIKIGSWVLPGDEAPAQDRPILRQALVFSNEYRASNGYRLPNTEADGEKVATSLLSSGYETNHVRNSDRAAFFAAVADFQDRLQSAGDAAVGLVYFAGYGTSLGGENYLIPDGPIPYDKSGLHDEAIKLADLVSQLESATAQAIVVLVDCGRPFKLGGQKGNEPGFAESFGRDKVVIAYADAPGEQHADGAAESLFAEAFARNVLSEDRIDIEAVMLRVSEDVRERTGGQQTPWFQTSLELPIFFRADASASVEPQRKTRKPYRRR
jgi:uncharacterized caspase-like protein